MRKSLLMLLLVVPLLLVSCGLSSGTVVNKFYNPAHTVKQTDSRTHRTKDVWVEDKWGLRVKNEKDDLDTWFVTETVYNEILIGDTVKRENGAVTVVRKVTDHS